VEHEEERREKLSPTVSNKTHKKRKKKNGKKKKKKKMSRQVVLSFLFSKLQFFSHPVIKNDASSHPALPPHPSAPSAVQEVLKKMKKHQRPNVNMNENQFARNMLARVRQRPAKKAVVAKDDHIEADRNEFLHDLKAAEHLEALAESNLQFLRGWTPFSMPSMNKSIFGLVAFSHPTPHRKTQKNYTSLQSHESESQNHSRWLPQPFSMPSMNKSIFGLVAFSHPTSYRKTQKNYTSLQSHETANQTH
jgi:hypothetical protein